MIVWQRSDGTFCQDTPTPFESSQTQPAGGISDDPVGPDEVANSQFDANPNYPWNPFPGSGPESPDEPGQYSFLTNWDRTTEVFALDPLHRSLVSSPGQRISSPRPRLWP